MKILILNWRDPKNPFSGGAEYVTMEHAKSWIKAGNSVTWFTSVFVDAQKEEKLNGVTILRKGSPFTVHIHAFLYYLFSGEKFDIVIDEIHGIPFFTPLYVRKSKIIAFIHEVAGEIWDYMYPFPINIIGKIFELLYFSIYKNIYFWTDAPSTLLELEKHGIPKKNCIAIPCPISNSTVSSLPVKEKNPTYIFVSRLVKMKGIENTLKAFSEIKKNQHNAQLWLVGIGEKGYVKFLKNTAKKFKIDTNTIFFGKVSENKKLHLMQKAHILLHASVKEGWGLVVLEAASQGTPSVVYKVAGLIDTVKNEKTGTIVKNNTPEALAKAAIKLQTNGDLYKKLQNGGIHWVKSLTWDNVTRESLILLEKMIQKGK